MTLEQYKKLQEEGAHEALWLELLNASGFAGVLENKWYVDELYDAIISKPVRALGGFLGNVVDNKLIDGVVNGTGRLVQYGSRQLRWLQSGQVGSYLLIMVVSIVVFLIIQIFAK